MGKGNSTDGGDVRSVKAMTPLEGDVRLGLDTETSYPCKKTSFMSISSPYHHQNNHHHYHQASEIASRNSYKSTTDGVFAGSGKVFFTAIQWQELERQTMIYKYIMASIPVPPQLLVPLSTQSNSVSTGLRFSNGSDPEPWRCRRTDGKKWRCARDVAPDQKYCERHANKTRTRSRKPVETLTHNTKDNPTMVTVAPSSNQQTRGNEWFIKNGPIHVSPSPSGGSQDFNGNHQDNSYLDHNNLYINDTCDNANDAAWLRIGSGDDCSLTLSMQSCENALEFDDESFEMAHQWLNHGSWVGLGSTPGGPLGEALCQGITSSANMPLNESFLNGYGNNSFEDGGDHVLG